MPYSYFLILGCCVQVAETEDRALVFDANVLSGNVAKKITL